MIRCVMINLTIALFWTTVRCSAFLPKTTQTLPFRRINKRYGYDDSFFDLPPHPRPLLFRSSLFVSGRTTDTKQCHRSRDIFIKGLMGGVFRTTRRQLARLADAASRPPSFLSTIRRKKCLSTLTALAIYVASFFGAMVALPANAVSAVPSDVSSVSVANVANKPTSQAAADAAESEESSVPSEAAAKTGNDLEERDIAAEDMKAHHSPTISGGDTDAWKAQESTPSLPVEREKKPSNLVSKGAGAVAAAAATGGGVFLASKKFQGTGNDHQEKDADQSDGASAVLSDTTVKVVVTETITTLPLNDPIHVKARNQPKSPEEEAELAARYAEISDVGERAFQILVDLGMVELNQ